METTEIKRYAHKWDKTGMTRAFESPNGEWVRWEDVKALLVFDEEYTLEKWAPSEEEQNEPPPP